MKSLVNSVRARWFALSLVLVAFALSVGSALAVDDPLFTTATTEVTADIASTKTYLGIAIGVTVAFFIFKLVKRGINRA